MTRLSFFGPPRAGFQAGGAHIAVYIVPVFEGRLVVFDVDAPGVWGRFLPWTVLAFGGNPYVDASLLVDDWCHGAVSSLKLVDAIGGHKAEGSEELAIVFRAELTAPPEGDEHRKPVHVEAGEIEAVRPFAATDLRRWVEPAAAEQPPVPPEQPEPGEDSGPRFVF